MSDKTLRAALEKALEEAKKAGLPTGGIEALLDHSDGAQTNDIGDSDNPDESGPHGPPPPPPPGGG